MNKEELNRKHATMNNWHKGKQDAELTVKEMHCTCDQNFACFLQLVRRVIPLNLVFE